MDLIPEEKNAFVLNRFGVSCSFHRFCHSGLLQSGHQMAGRDSVLVAWMNKYPHWKPVTACVFVSPK